MRNMCKMLETLDKLTELHPEFADELAPVKEAVFMPLNYYLEQEAASRLDDEGIDASEEDIDLFADILKGDMEIINTSRIIELLDDFLDKRKFRYYSIRHPLAPGAIPCPDKAIEVRDFDDKIFCREIGDEAWGYVDYTEPLTEEQYKEYELIPKGMKPYWCVTSTVRNSCAVSAAITSMLRAMNKPENSSTSLRDKDVYIDWFDSWDEAEEFARKARQA